MIKDFTPRLYQETIFSTCVKKNTLVVLPTGLGKTNIFLMLASQRLRQYPNSKILFLGPTRPLIDQYLSVFKKHLVIDPQKMVTFTGFIKPDKRAELWKSAQVIFSTPQGLENDVISGRIILDEVSLIGFDEAHKAVKDYSYVWVAKQYQKTAKYPKIIGLTASPGSDAEKITEVCKNLHIEEVEVRTDTDPDVKQYIQEVKIDWKQVELPEEFKNTKKFLEDCFKSKLTEIKEYGYINSIQIQNASKKDMLRLQAQLHSEVISGNKDFSILKSISLIAEAMKIQHALELLETQGLSQLYKYMTGLQRQSATTKIKAVKNLVKDLNFRSALIKTERMLEEGLEHPKVWKLKEIVEKEAKLNPKMKIIVFCQFRDSATKIVEELNSIDDVKAKIFVGQAKKNGTGLTQKKQIEVLEEFRQGRFNTICMTSVGEEGLDIPQVDLVIFYEPIPSAIRSIQRRGRTGRTEKGRVIMLVTQDTRDVGYRWSAHYKEKRMYKNLDLIKKKINVDPIRSRQPSLERYIPQDEKVKIFADHREKGSKVIKHLIDLGVKIRLERLDAADYILSNRCGVEYKTKEDFVNSIIDGRLLQQLKHLKDNYERPVVVIEGEADIYSVRKIHPNAIQGMIATITIGYGIPIIYTKNYKETSNLLMIIAGREQDEQGRLFNIHADRKPRSLKEQQEYIISSLPGVGPALAKPLLKKLGSVKKVISASEEKLKKIDLIGEKKARTIKDVTDAEYEG